MNLPYRPIALGLIAVAFSALLFQRAQAGGSHYFAPVSDAVVKEECGGCHLAFPPSMLPASSWQRMMSDLKNHFGDDASVDAATAAHITGYLVANAGDTGGRRYSDKLLRGTPTTKAPLRITELTRWVREHREVPAWEWKHKDVRSKANCVACHAAAERGYYDD
ncbi:Diheme cytochrome c [Candidatus Accumulibacter aalborgensis]|uniref:Diheme cytochrome c n=1 Tax=Candidatus Accumulibacter aalborgensis TaxID=1860102 RepID=A0A1A8XL34_9PROT|nr:diheme cytochrome c [Candidatus Accumulibacter aalborgensis]SBT05879.1 Diheme cytochrome c [Candidatus Accumulibacter aalborgensis]